jgi:two-component system, chemotaxis family, CheB/CheR fusion protein
VDRTNGKKRTGPTPTKAAKTPGAPPPIVAIGASAGGLEAVTELLRCMPPNAGLAYVLIQHLDPSHASQLTEVLRRALALSVHEIGERMTVEADQVYVIPSNADVGFQDGLFTLQPRTQEPKRLHLPIDAFFQALAADRGDRAIGVVLSGTGEDGSEGLKTIRAEGGITLVQSPETAKFAGMPDAAIRTGAVDFVLALPALAAELVRIGQHPYLGPHPDVGPEPSQPETPATDGELSKILGLLRHGTGVDFAEYKPASIQRRLARRMAVVKADTLGDYARLLRDDEVEVKALFEDLLIHVSSFFRDPEVFDQLKRLVFPEILKNKRDGGTIRIWVAGCATGQEVYSIVIALVEFLADADASHVPIQVFGTDLSDRALDVARAGLYAESAARVIGADRLQRFFTKADAGGYRIAKAIRDRIAFVRHDMGHDPPFSKLDLVSCRNVLIYMAPPLQKQVIATFQFALAHPGFLLLGRSENVAAGSNLFAAVDQGNQIYARTLTRSALRFARDVGAPVGQTLGAVAGPVDVVRLAEDVILQQYAPCGVVVNDRMEILQFRGRTAPYLEPSPGQPQHHLLRMAKKGLVADLSVALSQAREQGTIVQRRGVSLETDGTPGTCDLAVIPVARPPAWPEHVFAVLFDPCATEPPLHEPATRADTADAGVAHLNDELTATKAYLQSVLEHQQQSNDQLQSVNQELVSGNEELQSLNEELGTAKEELQSTNEEMSTLNEELHSRNAELDSVNSDLVNILASVEVPIVIVDGARRIRRFTPKARPILNLIASDIGRPIDDIRPNITIDDLDRKIETVIETLVIHEEETVDRDGHWYRLQIRPYTNVAKRVDGAVLSIVDVDVLKRALGVAEAARDDATATLEAAAAAQITAENANRTKDDFLATLSHELRTPLSSLLLQAQLLRRGNMDGDKLTRTAQAIERATKAQAQLIDDLLDVSRIVAGKLRLEHRPVDLAAVASAALDSVRPSAERKGLSIELESDGSPRVSGDPGRLQQVVLNLITNAIKFTPPYGHVTILVGVDGPMARIVVKDDGVGMEPDFLPLIFERFSQEHHGKPRTHAGLGLGLAIVQHLVDAHGGTIRADSAGRDRGATFTVLLPLMAADQPGPDEIEGTTTTDDSNLNLLGLKVLLVDDDLDTLQALAEMLGQMGVAVETASTVRDAMTRFQARRPSLLISDLSMPDEGGYGLIGRIRALDAAHGGDVPALALTALAQEEDRRSALRAGFDAHVSKPVAIDRLVGAMTNLLGQRGTLMDLELFPTGLSH